MHTWGLIMVMAIQIIGPLAIYLSSLGTVKFDLKGWKDYTFGQWCTVVLSWCFLFCFILNAYYCVEQDRKTGIMLNRIARALIYVGEPVKPMWLWVDAAVNCFCAVTCSWCMYSLLLSVNTPKDVMMDALGLVFLLRIDDISGEMGFLRGVWDDSKVGKLYEQLKDAGVFDLVGVPIEPPDAEGQAGSDDGEGGSDANGDAPRGAYASQQTISTLSSAFPVGSVSIGLKNTTNSLQEMPKQVPTIIFLISKMFLVTFLLLSIPAPFVFAHHAEDFTNRKWGFFN